MKSLVMAGIAAVLATQVGCSVLVNRSEVQCETDADCVQFGGHPSCRSNVCVASGLGPEGCVVGEPTSQGDIINACSTAQCVPFDNCARLGLCNGETAPLATMDPVNAAIPPLVNPTTAPTALCADQGPNLIYMYGTADFAPMLKAVQPLLSAGTPRYRAIYQNASSCAGVVSVFDSAKRLMKDPTGSASNYAFYFDDAGVQTTCLVGSAGATIDIGVSNLFSTTCNTDAAQYVSGNGVNDYTGPVVPFVLSVPSASSQESISAEAAHMVFGRGGRGPQGMLDAAPWTDPTYYFIRSATAGSTVLSALMFDVPKTKFWGVDRLSTDNLRDSMLASTAATADQSIGILSIDYADKNRGNLRSLYLQSEGQHCGYLPDSTKNTFDKANVRDGHYGLWGYVHFFTPVGPGGVPSDAAKALVTRFAVSRLDQQLLDNVISASLVPQCAMKVTRSGDQSDFGGQNGLQCGCYFDSKTKGATDCTPCQTTSDCPSARSACNYGYCELN